MAQTRDGFETFFSPTSIALFGKVFSSIEYVPDSMDHGGSGADQFSDTYNAPQPGDALPIPPRRIERVLRRGEKISKNGTVQQRGWADQDNRKRFARIYSFSYEGHYYRLPRPLLFLVSGEGDAVVESPDESREKKRQSALAAAATPERIAQVLSAQLQDNADAQLFTSSSLTGVAARDWQFSRDIRVWKVDRKDLAICLDVEIGNYQEILLDTMINTDAGSATRGGSARGDAIPRGAGSFRGDAIGPHQSKL